MSITKLSSRNIVVILKCQFVLFALMAVASSLKGQTSNDRIVKLEIKYVAFNILTITDVKCDDFEKSFDHSQLKEKTVSDSAILSRLLKSMMNIKYAEGQDDINTRAKFYVYYSNQTNPGIICLDGYGRLLINGKKVRRNKRIATLLKQCLTF